MLLFQYVRLKLTNDTRNRFPNYGLYAYGEGKMAEKVREHKFSGIPILFVPGNSGSHKQACCYILHRSIFKTNCKIAALSQFSINFIHIKMYLFRCVHWHQLHFERLLMMTAVMGSIPDAFTLIILLSILVKNFLLCMEVFWKTSCLSLPKRFKPSSSCTTVTMAKKTKHQVQKEQKVSRQPL